MLSLSIAIKEISKGNLFLLKFVSRLLERKKKLPESEALQVLKAILNEFLDLLINGVIHQDLKPSNILIHEGTYKFRRLFIFNKIKYKDFGYAKILENF